MGIVLFTVNTNNKAEPHSTIIDIFLLRDEEKNAWNYRYLMHNPVFAYERVSTELQDRVL